MGLSTAIQVRSIQCFHKFQCYIRTQFAVVIKVICSDNALNLTLALVKIFFAANGMVHQTSCVDRPQQNGIVERKHKHILQIARALRFHAELPLHFWGDSVLTAVHLIKRLPTPVLSNKAPYEVLLNKLPKYKHLRVFGCLVFALNPARVKDKLMPKGVPCVFLGYPHTQKGYKLLNLLTKQNFYILRCQICGVYLNFLSIILAPLILNSLFLHSILYIQLLTLMTILFMNLFLQLHLRNTIGFPLLLHLVLHLFLLNLFLQLLYLILL